MQINTNVTNTRCARYVFNSINNEDH